MLKTIFINTLKILVAGSLIYWLVSSGKLDFKLLLKLKEHPLSVAIAIVLTVLNIALISFRWRFILNSRSEMPLPIKGMIRVNWIGQFFSSVLPGSVSGDLVKVLYVQNLNQDFSKKFVFASILIDRFMGLFGLILLVGTTSAIYSSRILSVAPEMKSLLMINFILMAVVVASLLKFFFLHDFIRGVLVKLQTLFLPRVWVRIIGLWDDLTAIKSKIIKAVAISVMTQFFAVVSFWILILPFIEGEMDLFQALTFIPVGLMTLALPIAPSGLGVGHAIFQKLFLYSGISNGASLFNLYFFVTLSVNLLGAIPYLMNKNIRK